VGELGAAHRRRLREMWRGAGWPCHDNLELDLLAAGMLQRHWCEQGRETLRVTDAGIALLAAGRDRNRRARSAHEDLVQAVAQQMQRAGRIAWRGLVLRVPLVEDDGSTRWVQTMPDVFSIRNTTVEDYVEPAVHEIKVSRADLLSDLRHAAKGRAYQSLASQCWYVLAHGIGGADDVPTGFGVLVQGAGGLVVERPAPRRPARLGLAVWMALAKAGAEAAPDEAAQQPLAPPVE
jgi:hypothetical protein